MFIVYEGHDGVGKTEQSRLLHKRLTEIGKDVILVRSPGGSQVAEELRILSRDSSNDPITRSLLMIAAMRHTWKTIIQPALNEGKYVIADRWLWSGYLFQVVGEEVDEDVWLNIADNLRQEAPFPDVTVVLTVDEEERTRRKRLEHAHLIEQGMDIDIMELQGSVFEERVNNAITKGDNLINFTDRVCVVHQDEDESIDTIHNRIVEHIGIDELLPITVFEANK